MPPPQPPKSQPPRPSPAQESEVIGSGHALRPEETGLYRLLVHSVEDYAIFALDPKGLVISWNVGAERFKGYKESEIIGRHYSIFYPPEDIVEGKPKRLLETAVREGRVEDMGWRVRKDGTRFWADVVITALRDDSGAVVGFAKVTRDLTERRAAEEQLRQSEERFRLIVTTVKDYGVFMLDTRGRVQSWNEGAKRITGYTEEEILGRHFSVFYPEEGLKAAKPEHELKVATRDGRYEDEDWRVRKDGTLFWANVVVNALRTETGKLLGFAKITRDLSERKAAENRAIADARRIAEIESANRTKAEFLAAMSHELRTPLNAIGGYAELMEMGVAGAVSDQQREYLARIRTGQHHLLSIINDLLNYSRIESGQVTYDIESLDLQRLVERVTDLVAAQATLKHMDLAVDSRSDRVIARADRLKTEQVVLNLLSNAVKFTAEGGRVRVRCGVTGDKAWIAVTDTGPGIPVDKRETIFEPFVQLGRSLSSIREGTGLGLAISRDLARAMGGDIAVSGEVGRGSAFTLTLPRD